MVGGNFSPLHQRNTIFLFFSIYRCISPPLPHNPHSAFKKNTHFLSFYLHFSAFFYLQTSPAADASNSLNPSLHPSLQSYSFQPTTSSQLLLHLFACLMSPDDQERNGDGSSTVSAGVHLLFFFSFSLLS
eukprot:TRINITY_DN7447_c0_g1_i4.p1 TRINITY_DN7447_c0_g1~~TRINITY_DN7447_c0_g1_i4.p1  ORF type:complete len:130 (-),score=21.31 TRINITY_DN7447_c0_g1_i4:113-502(-)